MAIRESSMGADALEIRIARLEGAYEQIDKRLGSVEARMASLERKVDEGFARLRQDLTQAIDRVGQKLDATFRWVIGIVLINWITLMLAILLRR
jgi:tetrahydromethanopterin S-methyltransferase subunit G